MIDYLLIFLNYIQLIIDSNYFLALIIYFIFCLVFFSLSLPGGFIIPLASGLFFGFYIGFLINIISITIGSFTFIIISKYILKNFFSNYLSKYLDKLNNLIKKSTYEYLILIRLVLGVPIIIQNLFISSLKITKVKIFISSIIGFTPYFLFFTYIGDEISNLIELKSFDIYNIFSKELIIIISIFCLLLFYRILKKNI